MIERIDRSRSPECAPAHIQALRDHKRRAGSASATDRLVHAVPASAELLMRAAQHGHALQTIVAGLGRLLLRYGARELEAAILEVLKLEGPAPHPTPFSWRSRSGASDAGSRLWSQPTCPGTCWTRTSRSVPPVSPPTTSSRIRPMTTSEPLRQRAERLRLHGLLSHWNEAQDAGWAATLLDWEETERARRSLERRLKDARIGRFKPLADFDWSWPTRCDRAAIDALMALDFLNDAGNAVVVGPNGVGKSTIARNIAHQAVLQGHTALFTSAGQLLGDLAAIDSASALRRRLSHYAAPALLVIDEVGYLSYSNRHADMLFELISRRYEAKSTLVTTNRPFSDWHEVFPGAACVVSLVDRLVHNAEVIAIDGDSYRLKEAKERAEQRARQRRAPSS